MATSGQVVKSSGQVNQEVIAVKLDIVKPNVLPDFCTEARTRAEEAFTELKKVLGKIMKTF